MIGVKMHSQLENSKVRVSFMKKTSSLFALVLILGMTAPVSAQSFPQKRAITLVVPFAPGGGTDAIARDLAKPLADKLGVPVVVDNKGGAGGAIAAQQISQAKPDGHTLLFVTSTFVTAAATDRKLPYDVNKDFSPISKVGSGPLLLVVNPQTGITQVTGLIENAKRNPNSLNYVSAGQGSINHLSGELFAQRTVLVKTGHFIQEMNRACGHFSCT